MELSPINADIYTEFIKRHFAENKKKIAVETIQEVYKRFEGITWYIQFMANSLYAMTAEGEECTVDKVNFAIENILSQLNFTYLHFCFNSHLNKKKFLLLFVRKERLRKSLPLNF